MPNYWDEELSVLSTENVNFAVGTAGLGSRFVAVFIDLVIQIVVCLGFVIFGLRYMDMVTTVYGSKSWLAYLTMAVIVLGLFLIFYAYFFLFEWLWHGLTPGKRMVGLRVLQANGLPATFWQVLVRNIVRIVDFMPLMYGVGAIAVVFNDENRRLGDQAAGTVVARERREEAANKVLDIRAAADAFLAASHHLDKQPQTAAAASATTRSESVAMRVRIPTEDYEIARDFLLRRKTLQPSARTRLANIMAKRLSQLIDLPVPPETQSESFLEYVVKNYEK